MGVWVTCSRCAGTGIVACTCGGRVLQCPICGDSGEVVCDCCHGCGNIYEVSNDNEEDEFVFDEY